MSLETTQRSAVISALAPLAAFSVENLVGPGTPDVFFVGGCLELKAVDKWPRKGGVLREGVNKTKFTAQQRIFARTWRRAGGFHCVCLQVDQDWFLIEGRKAATHLGVDWTEEDIHREAWRKWVGGLNKEEFLKEITEETQKKEIGYINTSWKYPPRGPMDVGPF